jgi:transposase InsO family protein
MFLTDLELYELTGYKLPSAQRRWLRDRGWKHELNRAGKPRVSRAYCESRLGVTRATHIDQPNWEALLDGKTT